MAESTFSPRTPLLPVEWVVGAQVAISIGMAVSVDTWSGRDIVAGLAISLMTLGAALLAWLICQRHARSGRWLIVVSQTATISLSGALLAQPIVHAWLVAPVGLAIVLIGQRAGLAMGMVAIVVTIAQAGLTLTAGIVLFGLVLAWLIVAAAEHVGRARYEQGEQLYHSATQRLQATQEQQAQFKLALEDLSRANAQLNRLNALTQGLRQIAEEARADKERFAANVSHELRAPLNIILGFSSMLLESAASAGSPLSPMLQADLAAIQRNAAHLSTLIDDVLDLSQMEAGYFALDRRYTDLAAILHAVGDLMRGLFENKGLTLTITIAPDLPAVFCDGVRIREVLINLVNNAWRFTERGGVRIEAKWQAGWAHITVTDTGPGIPEDQIGRLFRPFQQVKSDAHSAQGGTGLGLAISKQIIELHGGRIGARNEPQAGATFYMELPIDPPGNQISSFQVALREGWEFQQRTRPPAIQLPPPRPRLLIVDATPKARRALQRQIDDVDVELAPDIETACMALSASLAQAVVINADRVEQGLQQALAHNWPDGVLVMICALNQREDIDLTVGNTRRIVQPVSREALARALHELGAAGGGRALIVDDNPDSSHLLERMLLSIQPDYRIWLTRNSVEAMRMMSDELPAVVLLDLMMPNGNGWELLDRRKDTPAWSNVPVIIISAQEPVSQPPTSPAVAFVTAGGFSARHIAQSLLSVSQMIAPGADIGGPESATRPDAPPA